jgi:hypothetical protein
MQRLLHLINLGRWLWGRQAPTPAAGNRHLTCTDAARSCRVVPLEQPTRQSGWEQDGSRAGLRAGGPPCVAEATGAPAGAPVAVSR